MNFFTKRNANTSFSIKRVNSFYSVKSIALEQAFHNCPRCKDRTVQLTRFDTQCFLFKKKLKDDSDVKYKCSKCKWKNEELPDDVERDHMSEIYGGSDHSHSLRSYPSNESMNGGSYSSSEYTISSNYNYYYDY